MFWFHGVCSISKAGSSSVMNEQHFQDTLLRGSGYRDLCMSVINEHARFWSLG